MKKRYEVRDESICIGKFKNEKEVEKFLLEINRGWDELYVVSNGNNAFWAIGAMDYLNKKGTYLIPAENRAEKKSIEPKPVSLPGPSNLPHVGPGGPIT